MSVATLSPVDTASQINAATAIDLGSSVEGVTEGSALAQVRQWLLDYRASSSEEQTEIANLDLDLDLIENRVIDSLGFMNFVFFLEELTGRELIAEAQSANSFRTLRIIDREILQGGGVSV